MDELLQEYVARAEAVFSDRRVVFAGFVLAGTTKWIELARNSGALDVFVFANTTGLGSRPELDADHVFVAGTTASSMSDDIRATLRLVADPPRAALDALDRFDPERSARVVLPPFLHAVTIGGRRAYGARPAEWAALEDKTVSDAIFAGSGIATAPSSVVAVADATRAAATLDAGAGTVWSGDARAGFNGGGEFVRWVRDGRDAARAVEFFTNECDRVRIMAFLEGIPCSVHGFVTDDGVAALRPCEMLVFRRPPDHVDRDRFVYAGSDTFWDPPPADREQMRVVARDVGEWLRAHVDYRGAFTVDGVLTAEGFRPTEVNPRFGGALHYPLAAVPELPLQVIHQILVAGDGAWIRAADIEALVLDAADATRAVNVTCATATSVAETHRVPVGGHGNAVVGPSAMGGLIKFEADVAQIPTGPSLAPTVAEVLRTADHECALGLGPIVPATSVR